MKSIFYTVIFLLGVATVSACSSAAQEYVEAELTRSNQAIAQIDEQIYICKQDKEVDAVVHLQELVLDSSLNVGADKDSYNLNEKQLGEIGAQRQKVDSVRKVVKDFFEDLFQYYHKVLVDEEVLVESVKTYPVYLKKGSRIILHYSTSGDAVAKCYNADSKTLLKTYLRGEYNDTISVQNTAIYIFEISAKTPQYCNLQILQMINSVDELKDNPQISMERVEANVGDFRVHKEMGVDMKPIFEEPHKMTVRSKLKYWMDTSSPYRTIAVIQVPSGYSDLLYHLRISTDDDGKSTDGAFFDDVYTKYKKIKFLGLPIYESTKNRNGLFRELLAGLDVQREEKAYCNLYVFTNAAQAKRFQEGGDVTKLSYNMDYSIMGTQSINERIPVKGFKTIYLGIENTRQRYDLYLWLEVIAAVPKEMYYTEKYTVIDD